MARKISKKKLEELKALETERTKVCIKCSKIKPLYEFNMAATGRKLADPRCKECLRKESYKSKYGILFEKYEKLLQQQNGKCIVCGSNKSGHKSKNFFCIDHDHRTGEVRGLLCNNCNLGLGYFKDNPEALIAAAAYLLKHKDKK